MKKVAISNFFRSKVNSLDPSKYPDTKFHLCSIPAFDKGKPEELLGNEIGSSKKVLIEGDVVLSRLIPHIKRVWEIPILNENTVLGSGEWIVFNSTQVFGGYLRHFLQSELFHKQFMATVKGVGGSLLRADVSQTGKIEIPLPQLNTQQRIATILDEADTLCKKTQQLIDSYDELAQSIFLDMFGDPVTNPKGFKIGKIRDLTLDVKYGTSAKASDIGKYTYLRMNNLTYSGYMDYSKLKYIDVDNDDLEKYSVRKGDLLFNRTNSKELVGKTAIVDSEKEMVIAGYLIRVRFNNRANPYFVWGYLNSVHGKLVLINMCKSIVGMANINAQELQGIKIHIPPVILQNQFAEKIALIEKQKELAKQSLKESEDLFNTLLQKAFKGELELK